MDFDSRQQFRMALLVVGWGMVGVNLAVGFIAGALMLSIPMAWATWVYIKKNRDRE